MVSTKTFAISAKLSGRVVCISAVFQRLNLPQSLEKSSFLCNNFSDGQRFVCAKLSFYRIRGPKGNQQSVHTNKHSNLTAN